MKNQFIFLLLISLIFFNAYSQSITDSTYILPEVIVVAGALSTEIGSYFVLDSVMMTDRPGLSLSDALNFIPGTQIKIGARGEAEFSLRGAIGRDVKLYIDNRPVSSPWNGQINFASIPLHNIKKIMVITGPPPLKYGSNLGGALDISTVEPPDHAMTSVALEYGSGDFKSATLAQSFSSAGISAIAELAAESSAGYPLPSIFKNTQYENGGLRDNSDQRRYSAYVKTQFPLFNTQSSLSCGFSDEVKGIPPNAIQSPYRWRFKGIKHYYADFKQNRNTFLGKYESHLYFDGSYDRLKRYTNDNSNYEESQYIYDSIHRSQTYGWDNDFELKLNRILKANFGSSVNYNLFSRQEQTPASDGFPEPDYNHSVETDVYFGTVSKVTPITEVSLGLSSLNLWSGTNENWNYLAPRMGLSVSPWKSMRLVMNLGRNVQFPTFFHLYSDPSGNPQLKPETAWRGEVGGRCFLRPTTALSLWYYHSFIYGRVDRVDRFSPFQNFSDSQLWGVEFSLEHHGPHFKASLGITRQYVKLEPITASTFIPLGAKIPPWKIIGYYYANPSNKLTILIDASYTAHWEEADTYIGEHTLINIAAFYKVRSWLQLNGSLENALDQEYSLEYGFPLAGRVWKMGMKLNYE